MKTGLEDALAECLEDVENGDSLEDCLARYPELARELEPLLRTALGLQQLFDVDPRPSFQRAARQRFLTAALRPRRPRLVVLPPARRRFSFGWQWAPAAVGAPVLAAAIALAVVMGLSGGGGGAGMKPGVMVRAITPAPSATETLPVPEPEEIDQLVERLEVQLGQMQEQVEQGAMIPSQAIRDLKDINQSLQETLPVAPPEAVEAAPQIAGLLDQQQAVLQEAAEQNQVAPESADDVNELLTIAGTIQEQLAATATPTSTPTPASSETPVSSPTATSEAGATATPTPASSPGPGAAGSETIVPVTSTPAP